MNVADFLKILENPEDALSPKKTKHLEELIKEYPYFQAARALYLKGLKNQNSYRYNSELKKTAAYTTDREVLFDFITTKNFNQKSEKPHIQFKKEENSAAEETETIKEPTHTSEISSLENQPKKEVDKIVVNVEQPIAMPSPILTEQASEAIEKGLALGEPLEFDQTEKHSFLEWLKITSEKQNTENTINTEEKKKKFELLDKFIENNPKIVPSKDEPEVEIDIKESIKLDKKEVMTETLARVYLEQKKYKKAIQAYEILRLKNPEKSSFFADRIKAVKELQKEKGES